MYLISFGLPFMDDMWGYDGFWVYFEGLSDIDSFDLDTLSMLAVNASAPGAQAYYDSVIGQWAEQGIDFVYLDGAIQDCAPTAHCWLGEIALIADAMKRLGNGPPKILLSEPPSPRYLKYR